MKLILFFLIILTIPFVMAGGSTTISGCANMGSDDYIYTQTQDIINAASCMAIGGNNITYDMNGYKIDGDDGAGDIGVRLYGDFDNNTIKNGIIKDFGFGVYLRTFSGTPNNNLINNITFDSNPIGFRLESAPNNIINNSLFLGNNGIGVYSVTGDYTDNLSIYNTVFNQGTSISFGSPESGPFHLYNVSINNSDISSGAWSRKVKPALYKYWKYNPIINNSCGEDVSANVNAYNNSGSLIKSSITKAVWLLEFWMNGTSDNLIPEFHYQNNYTINATNSSYFPLTKSLNLTIEENLNDNLLFDEPNLNFMNNLNCSCSWNWKTNQNINQNITFQNTGTQIINANWTFGIGNQLAIPTNCKLAVSNDGGLLI